MLQLVLAVLVGVATSQDHPVPLDRKFHVIAHMVNNEHIVRWALSSGANALEMDVQFHRTTGEVTNVHHGLPCDCTCYFDLTRGSVCDFDGVCTGATPHERVFSTIMEDTHLHNIALIYIDSKIVELPQNIHPLAGEKVIDMVEKQLFSKGYRGNVLIGAGSELQLNSAADRATRSAWMSQIYVTLDMFETTLGAIKTMVRLPYPNKVFSVGISVCSPKQYYRDSTLGAINKAKGLLSDVVAWTLDKESSWEKYYIAGARGIITNFVHNMLDWVARKGLTLARPTQAVQMSLRPVPTAVNLGLVKGEMVTEIGHCDCEYSSGGCSISRAAEPYRACHCVYKGAWQCSGQVVGCDQSKSPLCIKPDKSILSCVQGAGDCGGYRNMELTCDCKYSAGGCTVNDPAAPGYACQCSYEGFWMCSGTLTSCRDPHSEFCTDPDMSIFSCLQGKGDCGGYTDYTCDCNYGSGGCTIVKPSPAGTACRCDYLGAWTCSGTIVTCKNDGADDCVSPSRSIGSCVQGGGDCGAYQDHCACGINGKGCLITSPATTNTACNCHYSSFPYNRCTGNVAACGVYHSDTCHQPDTSIDSCLQGGGNCVGYQL